MAIASAIGRRSNRDVITIVTSWDGWQSGFTAGYGVSTDMVINGSSSILTRYGDRQMVNSDGSVYPNNWYQGQTGNAAAEQAVADDQAFLLGEAGITCRGFLDYPRVADLTDPGTSNTLRVDLIGSSLDYYLSSVNKTAHKFCIVLQDGQCARDHNSPGTWLNFANMVTRWTTYFIDSQYLLIGGTRPVVGLYTLGAPYADWDATRLNAITAACTGAGLGNPYFYSQVENIALANSLGMNGITTYGPNPLPAGSGQLSYANLLGQNKTHWSPSGSNQERMLPITTMLDTRPRPAESARWFDDPTYTEFEQRLRRDYAMARSSRSLCSNSMLNIYSLNETDEGGGCLPSPQRLARGVNSPSRGLILDAFKNVVSGTFPSTYDDHYHFASVHAAIARTGGANWTIVQDLIGTGGTAGAYKYSEGHNATVGNTWIFTSPNNVTRLKLYGRKAAALGTFNVHVDATADTLVNQVAGSTSYNQLLFDSGVLTAGVHSLTITVVTGCDCDELVASVSR